MRRKCEAAGAPFSSSDFNFPSKMKGRDGPCLGRMGRDVDGARFLAARRHTGSGLAVWASCVSRHARLVCTCCFFFF